MYIVNEVDIPAHKGFLSRASGKIRPMVANTRVGIAMNRVPID